MLQQTKVETVIPYYNNWIKKFPDIESVSKASESDLLKTWEGLGYYARCRNFHEAAKIVCKKYNSIIPSSWDAFRGLPGVGEYTAGAVLSIAFNKPFIALDGNVKRVMARITGRRKLSKNNTNLIISILNKWLDHNRPGDFNEAMMELGSCICIPRAPKCFDCPVKFFCRAFKNGSPLNYPKQIKKKRVPQYTFVGGLIRDKNKILIQQRDHKMLTGLWEIPNEIVDSANTSNKVLKNYIIENYGFNINVEKKLGVINHVYSHFKMKLILLDCVKTDEATKQKKEYKWINKSEIRNYPFHKVNHKIFSLINNDYWHI
jgi:A/G-specific adenine glycosylase